MTDIYNLAFANIPGIGPAIAKAIMEVIPSTEALFTESKRGLRAIFGNKTSIIDAILNRSMFDRCEKEIEFIRKYGINLYFFKDDDYPFKLKQIPDMPVCLFFQGNGNLNQDRMIAIVGTRNSTQYGKDITSDIVRELKLYNPRIVSGLAYGIDSYAHQRSLNENIPTFGVLGHGLDRIYPEQNFELAMQMREEGGLVTEYMSKTAIQGHNFPKRNRIIAGLCDAVICVEAAERGGALLTADLANQYDREVFAVPGRIGDKFSEGCNKIINHQKAHLLYSVSDIPKLLNWGNEQLDLFSPSKAKDYSQIISNLSKNDKLVFEYILQNKEANIDDILINTKLNQSVLAGCLLTMELEGLIECLPGKTYKIN